MMNKNKAVLLVVVALGGCSAASGPTFNAYSVTRPDDVKTFRVECHGLFESAKTCLKKADDICRNQPVRLIEGESPLGRMTSDGKPDTRVLVFQCGAHTEAAAPVVPVAPRPVAVAFQKKVTLSGDVNFETAKWMLRPDTRRRLDALVEDARGTTFDVVEVDGYTDSVGSNAANLKLSTQRANAVATYLVDHGLRARHVQARGHGDADPVASNSTAEGRSQNRRVEIQFRQNPVAPE